MENPAPLIPMKDFFKNPLQANFSLSLNGKYLAFTQPWENRLNVHVQNIETQEIVRVTHDKTRDILMFFWANNKTIAYLQDSGGDENYQLFVVDLTGENDKLLTPFEKVQVHIIDDLEDNEEEILIAINHEDKKHHDVYRANVSTGDLELVAKNPGNIIRWLTDNDGKLRLATTTDGVNASVLYRDQEEEEFRTIVTTNFKETLEPLFFTFDNKYVYMLSNLGRDKIAIVKYDIGEAKEIEVIWEHDEVDAYNLLRSKKRKKITGTTFITWKSQYHFFDEERKKIQDFLESKFPDYQVGVVDMSKDETKILARTLSDKSIGSYYFYNTESGEFKKLADVSPWLNEDHMADMKPISYSARDGLTIHGYLTLPKVAEHKNLPVVINPHGGPWHRDVWGFNKEAQFLANRGYAVLQMNFRGSTGYGRKFWEASFKEWGKNMQNDITDGVEWLVKEGIADPKRIGIYGGSYGGYAVLAGLTFTPDLYACGVDYVGVANLFTFMETFPPYWTPFLEMMYEMVGHPENDNEQLKTTSPVFHVDKIKVPLFIAQGANDPRVKKAESDQMVEALQKRGVEVPYMVKDNEGHGFLVEENRFDFYRAMEEFFAKHLGGRVEEHEEKSV